MQETLGSHTLLLFSGFLHISFISKPCGSSLKIFHKFIHSLSSFIAFTVLQITCMGLPRWLSGKESACNAGDTGLIPRSGRSPGVGNGNPLQYSCLRNSTAEEPGGLQFRGSQRVEHDLATKQQLASPCLGYCSRENLISLHSSLPTTFQHLSSSLLRTLIASYSNIKDQLLLGTPDLILASLCLTVHPTPNMSRLTFQYTEQFLPRVFFHVLFLLPGMLFPLYFHSQYISIQISAQMPSP